MIFNMHCRPSSPTNHFPCSSFLFSHSNISKHGICSPLSYPDQIPPPAVRRRRRLEDPIITYASNYYVTNPRQTSHSPSSTQIQQKSGNKNIYCDLFNLLERPQPVQQKKKNIFKDSKSFRNHRSIVYKNLHAKIKDINERKRHQQQQQKKNLSYDQFDENRQSIHQRHSSNKGFFRRVVGNYFCMPMTVAYREFSN